MKNKFWDSIETIVWRWNLNKYLSFRKLIKLSNLAEGKDINYLSEMQRYGFSRGLK